MNNQFDELTKQMAHSVTRRAALKKFGFGLVGMALACFGLANKADAGKVSWCIGAGQYCRKGGIPCCKGGCRHVGSSYYGDPDIGICGG